MQKVIRHNGTSMMVSGFPIFMILCFRNPWLRTQIASCIGSRGTNTILTEVNMNYPSKVFPIFHYHFHSSRVFHPHPKYDDESWTVKIENHFKQLSRGNIFFLKIITKPLRRYRALFQCCRQSILTLTECAAVLHNMITLLYTQLYRLKVVKLCIAGRKSKMALWHCTPLLAEGLKIFSHLSLIHISEPTRR